MGPQLRWYQAECVAAIWQHVQTSEQPAVAVLPTGAGKSLVLAQLAKDVVAWNGRAIVLAHVKELVQQNFEQIERLAPGLSLGAYSAGLGSRDVGYAVTVAGIQSVYRRAEDLGPADVIIVDEAHRIPPDGDGQYRTFLEAARRLNPNVRLVGLTATPYRTQSGFIYGKGQLFEKSVYEVGVRHLIVQGFLSPLKSKVPKDKVTEISTADVSIRGGEFVPSELQQAVAADESRVCYAAVEIIERTQDRKSVLVFCVGIDHARQVAGFLRDSQDAEVREIYGDTPVEERDATIAAFKAGTVKYLVNVDVLTTGFDAPGVDCVAVLRPTMSPGLWYQMVGRGFRLAPGKADCLVLDYGQNLMRHGPVDRMLIGGQQAAPSGRAPVAPWKTCPDCLEVLPAGAGVCLVCGYQFPRKSAEHEREAAAKSILNEPEEVLDFDYVKHRKNGADESHPPTLRFMYDHGALFPVSEFLCFEHVGFARDKAVTWWKERSDQPVPATVDEAIASIDQHGIKVPKKLVLQTDGKFLRIAKVIDLEHRKKERAVQW